MVAAAVGSTISAISRLERGHRSLRVDQLVAWAGSLGYRIDVVFWKPTLSDQEWDPEHMDRALGLDEACAEVLAEVAAGVAHMPEAARRVLVERMRSWRSAAVAQVGSGEDDSAPDRTAR